MKQYMRVVSIVLALCLLFSGLVYAEGVGQSSGSWATGEASITAATTALRNWIAAGNPVNGVKNVKFAQVPQVGLASKASGPKSLSLSAMPSEICVKSVADARRYVNPFSLEHPIVYTSSPSGTFSVTPTVTNLGTGTYAEISKRTVDGVDVYYLIGLAPGKIKLKIEAENHVTASKTITVKDKVLMSSLALYSVNYGSMVKASPSLTLTTPDPAIHEVVYPLFVTSSPSSASYGGITLNGNIKSWSCAISAASSNDAVVSVSSDTPSMVNTIYPKKAGTATLTVRATDGGKAKVTTKVTVKGIALQSVSLASYKPQGIKLNPGTTKKITPVFSPADAYNRSLNWSTSNKKAATVDSKGNVTGIAPGTATITCKNKATGKYDRVTVTVGYGKSDAQTTYRFFGIRGTEEPFRKNSLDMMKNVFTQAYGSSNAYILSDVEDMLSTMLSLGIQENDVSVIYITANGRGSIEASGVRGAIMFADGSLITVNQMQAMLEQIPGTIVLILDSDCSGQFISSKGASMSAGIKEAKAFNDAWISAFSSSKATNFTAKALTGSTVKSKFKILTACSSLGAAFPDLFTDDSFGMFSWFTYWLGKGLGAKPNRMNGTSGILSSTDLPANTNTKDGAVITLAEAYSYVSGNMAKEVNPVFRQFASVWPANDQTAVLNLVN